MKSNLKIKLGNIIKINRKLKNLSQQKLSNRINYNQSVVSKVERGNDMVHIDIYIKLLQYFNLNYVYNSDIDKQVNQIIEEVYEAFLYLNYDKLNVLLEKVRMLQKENQNAMRLYDLLILEFLLSFINCEYDKCHDMFNRLANFYSVCDEKCQICFIYVNIYFKTIYQVGENIDTPNLNSKYNLNQTDGFIDYIFGWCYYYEFNYSRALCYLLKSVEKFKNKNNIHRMIRSELIINEILLMDKHYLDVFIRTKKLILQYNITKLNEDESRLYFHLGYSAYYLKEYKQAKKYFEYIVPDATSNEYYFYHYMYLKCMVKMRKEIHLDLINRLELNKENSLIILFFNEHRDDNFYKLIETYLIPDIKHEFFKTEFQYYAFLLLDYYWNQKKYRQYKKLNENIHKILHIL